MLAFTELALLHGMPSGNYVAVHPLDDYKLAGFGFEFDGGRTGVIDGKTCARIFHGIDGVQFEPADDATRSSVVDRLRDIGCGERADALAAEYFGKPEAPADLGATDAELEALTAPDAPAEPEATAEQPKKGRGK